MTLGEIQRELEAAKEVYKRDVRQKAILLYKTADMMAFSLGRLQSNKNKMPEIYEVFPDLFNEEEILEARQEELDKRSVDNLLNFIEHYNNL